MRLSVLVPTYNRARCITRALHSACAGGWQGDLEIIVSDNASTDDSREILTACAARDPRIRVLLQTENHGPLANWRACLDQATGDFVHWLWSDDWIEPDGYGRMQQAMLSCGAGMCLSAARIISEGEMPYDPTQRPKGDVQHVIQRGAWAGRDLVRFLLGTRRPLVSPAAALLPIQACRQILGRSIPEHGDILCDRRAIGPDALMILEASLRVGHAACVVEPLVCFSAGPDSISVASHRKLAVHYAWARLGWARQNAIPRWWTRLDTLRLLRAGEAAAALKMLQ